MPEYLSSACRGRHHGYDITPEEMERKQARNLTMLQSALGETPFDDYLYFQMGQSYYN